MIFFSFNYDKCSNPSLSWNANRPNSVYQFFELPSSMKDQINGDIQEESFSSFNTQEDKDFRCPRCGQSMQEPRLLPCLHPICSTCISELMSKRKWYRIKNLM